MLTLLPWPYPPLRYTEEWDVVEAIAVLLVAFILACLACLALWRSRRSPCKVLYVLAVCASVCLVGRLWTETLCFARVSSPPPIDAVPELPPADFARMWEFKEAGLPVIVRGVLNSTIDLDYWSPSSLAERHGQPHVKVQLGNVEQNSTELIMIPFGHFLHGITDTEWLTAHAKRGGKLPYYAEKDDLFETEPELRLATRNLLRVFELDTVGAFHFQTLFWIGPAGALTGLHTDVDATNFLYQMHGSKRVWLYPIDQSPLVYPSTKYDLGASLAEVDHFHPDYEKFPRFQHAKPLVIDVHAGDVLYVPSHWYHAVESLTVSVSLSVRLYTLCESLSLAPLTWLDVLHHWGFYRHEDCVCHNPSIAPY